MKDRADYSAHKKRSVRIAGSGTCPKVECCCC